MKKVIKDILVKLIFNILKINMTFTMIYTFYLKESKVKKSESLQLTYMIKINMYTHKKYKTNIKSWISFEKSSRVIKFHQKAWLKLYIDMNTELKEKTKI